MTKISHIAVDARTLTFQETGERGIGTYTIEHISAWAALCPNVQFKLLTEKDAEFVRGERLLSQPNITKDYYTLSQKEFNQVDLFHVPDSMSMIEGFDAPFRMVPPGIKSSVLFHDLIPLVLRHKIYDKWNKNIQKAYEVRIKHLKDSNALILANSEATKNDLINLAGIPEDRIKVVMAGLSKRPTFSVTAEQKNQTKKTLGIDKPFLLVVGGLDEHKGFMHTLEASFELLANKQMQIIVVGSMIDPWKLQLKAALAKKAVEGVVFTGFISDQDLSCLYSEAIALVFPSEYEGFGFPVLEAMAHGCPVICSNKASLPEVAGNAAVYLDGNYKLSIFEAIRNLISKPELRDQLISKGRDRAKLFSWEDVARKTLLFLESHFKNPVC